MEPHEKVYKNKKQIFFNNIIGGFGWSIGATVGIAIIFAVLTYISARVNLVPIVGEFVASVIKEVLQKNPQLIR